MRMISTLLAAGAAALLGSCASLDAILDDLTGPERAATTRTLRAGGAPPPIFGDWWYLYPEGMRSLRKPRSGEPCSVVPPFEYPTETMYVPVNVPGAAHGGPGYDPDGWYGWYARCLAFRMDQAGAPFAVLIRERNAPFPFAQGDNPTSPEQVRTMLNAVPKLDYLFMDLEAVNGGTAEDVERNVAEIVRLVRSHPNPRVNNAFIGNYEDWPGASDPANIWPGKRDRTRSRAGNHVDRYRRYLNVAMPSAYPYEVYSRHTDPTTQKGDVAPSDRAAAFWAPIARTSAAARALPEGHLLIPWVSNYVAFAGQEEHYHAPPPPREDMEALIRHLRLRGAHSFMVWTANRGRTDHPTVDHEEYRELALAAWRTLDPLFDSGGGEAEILNLGDDKRSGVQWSGMRIGDRVWVLVSNLGSGEATVRLPAIPGLPEATPPTPPGEHRLYRFRAEG